jgi:hypothetical protein
MQSYASDTLYHFVGRSNPDKDDENFKTLCKVIESKEIRHHHVNGNPAPMVISIDLARGMRDGELIVQSVCCFCDIDFTQLHHIHTGKYGKFGIGLDRSILAEWGARPVIYFPMGGRNHTSWGNRYYKELVAAYKGIEENFPDLPDSVRRVKGQVPKSANDAVDLLQSIFQRDYLAFLKFFNVDLPDDHSKNFYMEREWRKFGRVGLEMTLKQVVVAAGFRQRFLQRFPDLDGKVFEI